MTATTGVEDMPEIRLRQRPLIVCDIDEVVLEFVTPFSAYLRANGYEWLPRSFRLTGNVVSLTDGSEAPHKRVRSLLQAFFANQLEWQTPADAVTTVLSSLSAHADILFLTAMPPQHYKARRALLDRHDMPYPLIATEDAKGPLIRDLHGDRPYPVAFVDDIVHNIQSVRQHVPHAKTLHYMANETFRALAPDPGDDVVKAMNWPEIEHILRDHIGA